jgi:cytochrome b561
MKTTTNAYGRLAVWLHWLSAALILVMAPIGMIMVRMADGAAGQSTLYRVHTMLGTLVLLLTLARVVWGIFDNKLKTPAGITGNQALLYKSVHYGLYIVLLILTSTGLGMMVLSGAPLPPAPLEASMFEGLAPQAGHSLFSKLFIVLFVAHMGGVFMYQFQKGDVLKRMGLRLRIGRAS